MDKIILNINKDVSATIFKDERIIAKINSLFKQENEEIKKRYNVVKNSFKQKEIRSIKFSTIQDLFKKYFLNKVANEAIELLFIDLSKKSLKQSILFCLTNESLLESVYGEEMLNAFKEAIESLPESEPIFTDNAMVLLKIKFSEFNPYSRNLKVSNYCSECGCYCRCDGKCYGDTKKCTSPHAQNCNHHCGCYILPLIEKRKIQEEKIVISTKERNVDT